MKIVILDGYTENPGDLSWDGFTSLGELTVYDRTPAEKIAERIGDSEIVILNKTPITREILSSCPGIKYIGVLATGYNVVDTAAAKEKNIIVSNIPTYGTAAVAQMVFALLLEICHHVGAHSEAVHRGDWTNNPDWCFWNYPLIELAGKTMGIIGFGRIGQNTAKIARALGMKVIAYDANIIESAREYGEYVTLDELFRQSDVLSLHCPLLPSTEGIISRESIAKMKDGVILINTSRGPLIAEQDLADALDSGKVYAAAVDVVSKEPISADNPLLTAKNCFITPHIAWAPKESRQRLMDIAVENVKAFLGGSPVNVVN
ncbi:D-2-hydroxyacid dehydrogenase [Breznakiella homolactica]|uniref:D-2-hydroxyacid dehydrogenase n=1 Tax=Breznakiella homolactica TaxID=2798577 RepID=A0A7T7XKK1_9SPIR|nr:D-2-hydroxyacid dehydrogenase [Breznakiella homolactica]QQO08130.1 D-2-hydroxyacid dehydrogenase [Breznakiella homolactica]